MLKTSGSKGDLWLYRRHAAASPIALSLRYTVVLPIPSNRAASRGLRFDLSKAATIIARSTSAIVGKAPVSETCAKTIGATDSRHCCVNRSVAVEINLEAS